MLGIEKLKEITLAGAKFGESLEDKLADGKLSFMEAISLVLEQAPKIFGFVSDAAEIKAEYLDLTDEERVELTAYLTEELDLDSDRAEKIAEATFDLLASLDGLIDAIKKPEE